MVEDAETEELGTMEVEDACWYDVELEDRLFHRLYEMGWVEPTVVFRLTEEGGRGFRNAIRRWRLNHEEG